MPTYLECSQCHAPLECSGAQDASAGTAIQIHPCAICSRKTALELLEKHLSRPMPQVPAAPNLSAGEPGPLPVLLADGVRHPVNQPEA
jgi:hypothetical protein